MENDDIAGVFLRTLYAFQFSRQNRADAEKSLASIYGGAVPFGQYRRLNGMLSRMHEKAYADTRVMHGFTGGDGVPLSAQIVAYEPKWHPEVSENFPNALQVRVDTTGDDAESCHVLVKRGWQATSFEASEWVREWHRLHPFGTSAVGGYFRRPTLALHAESLPAYRAALSGLDYDVITERRSESLLPEAGCIGLVTTRIPKGSTVLATTLIHDAMWGKASPPDPTPEPRPPHGLGWIKGQVRYETGQGTWVDDVVSTDDGATWQR